MNINVCISCYLSFIKILICIVICNLFIFCSDLIIFNNVFDCDVLLMCIVVLNCMFLFEMFCVKHICHQIWYSHLSNRLSSYLCSTPNPHVFFSLSALLFSFLTSWSYFQGKYTLSSISFAAATPHPLFQSPVPQGRGLMAGLFGAGS